MKRSVYFGCWKKDNIRYNVFQVKSLNGVYRTCVRLSRDTIFIYTLTNEETEKVLKDMNERNFIKIQKGDI